MKVYVATDGSYSDYQIKHVFLNEDDARTYAQSTHEGNYSEYEVREKIPERRVFYHLTWQSHLPDCNKNSNHIANPHVWSYESDFTGDTMLAHHWYNRTAGPNQIGTLSVEGFGREGVMKVYSEQRAMFLARQEGIA